MKTICLLAAVIWGVLLVPGAGMAQSLLTANGAETMVVRALVVARDRAVLSSELSGRITAMEPRSGGRFSKNAVLISFDCAEFVARRDIAKANARTSEARLRSVEKLASLNSANELDTAIVRSEFSAREHELTLNQINVDRCQVHAPFDGRVINWHARPHQVVAPGVEIMKIVADQNLEVEIIVPSAWLTWLKPGFSIELAVDETKSSHTIEVSTLGAEVDPVSQTINIRAGFISPPDDLLVGMSGAAIFTSPSN